MTNQNNVANSDGPEIFHLGDFKLTSGDVLPGAFIAYRTFGDHQNPAIVNPTFYTGSINDCVSLFSDSHASFNPGKYFIIVPALIGNGESISPSNTPSLRGKFPTITFADNVRAQHLLLTQKLGIERVKAVIGHSMGGAQAYQWAVQYPDFVDVIVPICASAKTSAHNNVFLEGVKSALIGPRCGVSLGIGKGQRFSSNETWTAEQVQVGLKAFARVYAGWGLSQTWYRQKLYATSFGAQDPEEFVTNIWEAWASSNDPDDLLVTLQTWQLGDISTSAEFGGDYSKALRSIKAKAMVMPCRTDLYFPPEDSQFEVENMATGRGTLNVIESSWGHWAGGSTDSKEDWEFIHRSIAKIIS